ncbi:MAG: proline dehydrogenase family protein [Flavobacteriales bacterium]|jgi:proline dehydrogenase|nr:proline dehydrogenase family protein [Flavobacteriales bacterium]MBP9160089.1 proline dehydrogenase family protein [Flavobacteriales bacterium]MCI1753590.1 proline dehydrogenase family protein [Flavobacteriales bacterium]
MPQQADPDPRQAGTLPDLGNTQTAFAHKSNRDLLRAYWLYRVIGTPWLTNAGSFLTKLALGLHLPVKGAVKATIFKQFCGGETIEESMRTAEKLAESGVGTILDYSVEGEDDQAAMDATAEEVLRTIAAAKGNAHIPFSVFKPTGVVRTDVLEKVSAGTKLSNEESAAWARGRRRFERICEAAHASETPVLIDAEESWIQQAIDGLAQEMMQRHNTKRAIIYNTVQLYRHDRLAFLREQTRLAGQNGYHHGVKLVRGAYMEKERDRAEEKSYLSPIGVNKAAVDADFDAALRFCAEHLSHSAVLVGTHNEASTLLMASLMQAAGLPKNDPRIHFGQLLGMSDNISFNMAAAGYNVVKYVPYGPVRKVLPYLIRRAKENTSARGQTGRELALIIAERKRRG